MMRENSKFLSFLNSRMSRRSVLKTLGIGGAVFAMPACSSFLKRASAGLVTAEGKSFSPIDRSLGDVAPRRFSGDEPSRAHSLLQDPHSYLAAKGAGSFPAPAERVPLVIVGGGMSGLFAGYLLRRHQPILLEQAERFGGNSKAESWRGIDYSIGAAYFTEQAEGSALQKLYAELGIDKMYRIKSDEDPVFFHGKRHNEFWMGETDPARKHEFQKLKNYFQNVLDGKEGLSYPELPIADPTKRSFIEHLDRQNFKAHLEGIVKGPLHPHIEAAIDYYCWSSFGASAHQISAASGLNFYAAEFGEIYVTPGGNAAVAERLLQKITASVPSSNLRPASVVVHVEVVADGVLVVYENAAGELQSIHAKAVVMACPKFVVKRILKNIEPSRLMAMNKLRYRSYLVGNLLINRKIEDSFYDLFMLGEGALNHKKVEQKEKVTDVILATYSHPDPQRTVLTLYCGIPYEGARAQLYAPGSYEVYRKDFEQQIQSKILPAFGLRSDEVVDFRLARWGHPLPVAEPGLIADGTIDQLRKPFRDRVFFIEQDNWILPALETAALEALNWAPQIEKRLR